LGSGKNLASLARRWSERDPSRRFLLPDLLGHGTSPALPPEADLDTLADAVGALLQELQGPADVVGHSLGGRVALALLRRAPARLASVTLLDIAPGPTPPASDLEPVLDNLLAAPAHAVSREPWRSFLIGRGTSPALADWLLMNVEPDAGGGLRWRIDRQALAGLHRRTRHVDLWPALGGAVPVHAVRGGLSRFVSDADVARLRQLGVDTHTIAGAGHFVHVDAQVQLLDILSSIYSTR
jgi:pimeloyl-ACP methyl ester carboxylesterase